MRVGNLAGAVGVFALVLTEGSDTILASPKW
jgi:hypothetical protein